MNAHIYAIAFVVFVVGTTCVINLCKSAKRYRALWIDMGKKREDAEARMLEAGEKWEEARAERDEWHETAKRNLEAWQALTAKDAARRKTLTVMATVIDSLMNGDRSCEKGHRYHSGEGVTCPHCGAQEVTKQVYLYEHTVD